MAATTLRDCCACDCRNCDKAYVVIRLPRYSAIAQQPRERSGWKSRENASLVTSRRRLTYTPVLLFLVNLLNFFDRTVPAVVLRPIRRNSCLNDTSLALQLVVASGLSSIDVENLPRHKPCAIEV
jgi:hypothetical protein